jgi:hypothetical protein
LALLVSPVVICKKQNKEAKVGSVDTAQLLTLEDTRFDSQRYKQVLTSSKARLLLGFAFLTLLSWTLTSCHTGPTDKVPIGKEGSLSGTGGTLTPVAITEAALDQFLKSYRANDSHGMVQMMATGLVFTVENGTKVLVIDYGERLFLRKIRILEGEMKGRAGYVPYEWVKPL